MFVRSGPVSGEKISACVRVCVPPIVGVYCIKIILICNAGVKKKKVQVPNNKKKNKKSGRVVPHPHPTFVKSNGSTRVLIDSSECNKQLKADRSHNINENQTGSFAAAATIANIIIISIIVNNNDNNKSSICNDGFPQRNVNDHLR